LVRDLISEDWFAGVTDPTVLAGLILVFIVAGAVKGVMGMGLPLVAITLMSTVVAIQVAMPYLAIPVLILNFWQAIRGPSLSRTLKRFLTLGLAACVGIIIGTELLFLVEQAILSAVLGVIVCFYVAINIFTINVTIPEHWEPVAGPIAGLISGITNGATGSFAPPFAAYTQALGVRRDDFVQGAGLVFFIAAIPWVAALAYKGALTTNIALVSTALTVPAAIGMIGGTMLRNRISEVRFRQIIFAALFLLGLNLIRKGFF
jgi:uncharacterized membrane protein YfcA